MIYQLIKQGLQTILPLGNPNDREQLARLASYLGTSLESLPAIQIGPDYHYRPFSVTKPDGSERRLLAPSPALKQLQRQLLHHYLSTLPVHPAATAFHADASVVANARRHVGQAVILTADLADFFDSTTADRVRAFFVKLGWRGAALALLMRLCVFRNALPQGAPTSPCLSNLVNVELDQVLAELAGRVGARYTRYGDDLTFSWRSGLVPGGFEVMVTDCLHIFGYHLQTRKGWNVWQAADEPQIAGVIIGRDGRLRVPLSTHWQAWKLRWKLWWQPNPHLAQRWQGYTAYIEMVEGED